MLKRVRNLTGKQNDQEVRKFNNKVGKLVYKFEEANKVTHSYDCIFNSFLYQRRNPQVMLYEKNACTYKTFTMWQLQPLDRSEPVKLQGTSYLHLPPSRSHQSLYCERQVVRLDKVQQAHPPSKCDQNLWIPSPVRYLCSMIEKRNSITYNVSYY